MTEQLPRPIEPGEIREGDRVRLTWDEPGSVHTHEFTVTFVDNIDGLRSIGYRPDTGYTTEYVGTWELLSRPTPVPAVGSRWRANGAEFVVRSDGEAYCYKDGDGWGISDLITPGSASWSALTPIPDHGDGCSEWLWDEETRTAWVAALYDVGQTHVQVQGHIRQAGYLSDVDRDREFAHRLIPWSERGQANG